MNWTRIAKEAWTNEIAKSDFDVVGTLKFIDGRKSYARKLVTV